ncbi:hypothetical protein GPECTOR_260g660 [Gonium pectorale]|uniref:ATP-dependent DNA helicase n=1 Tax=Gonium pectorale TaxID=33097 RepID=A0A150FW96_GONPE|nr:hypothetical protein GPECTOR_260g660 [Gonium pectorale]|eukprot:KXZ41857.1 hypothetical protein GPECTOR_260g660 [Gonium pectorale]
MEDWARERVLLFLPWRVRDEQELQQPHGSWLATYEVHAREIEDNAAYFERMHQAQIDAAKAQALRPEYKHDKLAQEDDLRKRHGPDWEAKLQRSDEAPSLAALKERYDFAWDLPPADTGAARTRTGQAGRSVDLAKATSVWPDETYHARIRQLNAGQRRYLNHFLRSIKHPASPDAKLRDFLSGGAGVGKSTLVNVLVQAAIRWFGPRTEAAPDDVTVIKLCPTGKAAFHIRGSTIHSGLALPVKNRQARCSEHVGLTADMRATLHAHFQRAQLVLIDEISMVGAALFEQVNHRLQDIMGTHRWMGGLHFLAVGDLFQCRPVADRWLFYNSLRNGLSELTVPSWHAQQIRMYELTEVMRTKNRDYALLLNRLRENALTDADDSHLQGLVRPPPPLDVQALLGSRHGADASRTVTDVPGTAGDAPATCGDGAAASTTPCRWICNTHAKCDAHNLDLMAELPGQAVEVRARDRVLSKESQGAEAKILDKAHRLKPADTSQLHLLLQLKLGMFVELTINVDVPDGLVHSADGIVRAFTLPPAPTTPLTSNAPAHAAQDHGPATGTAPDFVWVEFLDPEVGVARRRTHRRLHDALGLPYHLTPVWPAARTFSLGHDGMHTVERTQFPLAPAYARTVHHVQGSTMDCAAVDTSGSFQTHGLTYVALSRVTDDANGLYLHSWDKRRIVLDPAVTWEMYRLRTEARLQLAVIPLAHVTHAGQDLCIATHNVSSLHAHRLNFVSDPDLPLVDVLCLQETRLTARDDLPEYAPPGFVPLCHVAITYLNGALHRHFGGANFRRARTERQPHLCEVDRLVCLCGVPMHWLTVDVHVRSGTVTLVDSFIGVANAAFLAERITAFLHAYAAQHPHPGLPAEWHVRTLHSAPQQHPDGNDCGVFASLFMRCIAAVNDCPNAFPFDADDMVAGRGLLLREVLTSSILWMPQPRVRLLAAAP